MTQHRYDRLPSNMPTAGEVWDALKTLLSPVLLHANVATNPIPAVASPGTSGSLVLKAKTFTPTTKTAVVEIPRSSFGDWKVIANALAEAIARIINGEADKFGPDAEIRFGYKKDFELIDVPYGDPLGNGDLQERDMTAYAAHFTFGMVDLNS